MIPSILHQVYFIPLQVPHKKRDALPWQWKRLSKKSRKYLKYWYYYYWNFEQAYSLVQECYPQYLYFFEDNKYEAVVQSDVFRYIAVHHYGGWYFDFDCEITRPLDVWNKHDIVLPLERESTQRYKEHNMFMIGNSMFASKAKHPFWITLLNTIKESSEIDSKVYKEQDRQESVVHFSGPKRLSYVYHTLSAKEKQHIEMPECEYFHSKVAHPLLPHNYKQLKDNPKVYCIHYAHGLWKQGRGCRLLFKKALFQNNFTYYCIKLYRWIKKIVRFYKKNA